MGKTQQMTFIYKRGIASEISGNALFLEMTLRLMTWLYSTHYYLSKTEEKNFNSLVLKIIKHSWWWCTVIRDAYYKRWTHKHWVYDSRHVAHKHTQSHTFTSVLCSLRLREFRVLNVSVHLMHTSTQDQQKQVKKNYSSPALMPKNTLNSHCRILQSSSKQMSEAAAESAAIRLWRLKDTSDTTGNKSGFYFLFCGYD